MRAFLDSLVLSISIFLCTMKQFIQKLFYWDALWWDLQQHS